MEAAADLSAAALALQVDLLQLPPEIPAPGAPALRGVLDRLFAHWLSLLPTFPTHHQQPPSRLALRARSCGPLRAAAAPGGGKDDAQAGAIPNGSPVIKSKSDPSQNGVIVPITTDKSRTPLSTHTTPDSSGSRAGLFRTPISGGVQSATFAHGLPPPALAVRNLMEQEWAHKQYGAKHQQWGNFYYYRMQNISDIYFIGGFGTVAWVDVKEYEAIQPDKIAVDGGEQSLKGTDMWPLFGSSHPVMVSWLADQNNAVYIRSGDSEICKCVVLQFASLTQKDMLRVI